MLEALHARKAPRATMSCVGANKGDRPARKDEQARNIREASELLCKRDDEARAM